MYNICLYDNACDKVSLRKFAYATQQSCHAMY